MTDMVSTSSLGPTNGLQTEIDQRRREIQTEGYPMSVGELVNLYRDGELDIHPEFQRFFRWTPKQKSRFIESLLLGIPIPSIFVYQRIDGVWDVIDGLQRLSTIFEFMGLLINESGVTAPQSRLVATEYLPSLDGRLWQAQGSGDVGLDPQQQRLIKRAAIDVKIVRRESDEATKFDLFQRLNTGGSQLSDQEVRNCLLIMAEAGYYRWLLDLKLNEHFQAAIAVSDRAAAEQYDMELALRFLVVKDLDDSDLRAIGDMNDFLNTRSVADAKRPEYSRSEHGQDFIDTFHLIDEALADASFRRYDAVKGRFLGGFSVSAYEAVTSGVYTNLSEWRDLEATARAEALGRRVQDLWAAPEFRENSGSGVRASTRLPKIVPFARSHFKPWSYGRFRRSRTPYLRRRRGGVESSQRYFLMCEHRATPLSRCRFVQA